MTRRLSIVLGVVLVVALATAYGLPNATSAQSGHRQVPVRFAYDWPTPDFAIIPVIVARDKGFYRSAGIDLRVVFPPDVATTMKMLGIGQANIGYDTTTDVAFAKQQGVPAISIANFSQSNNWGLIGRPGERIDLHTLRGKSIGIYNDSWTKAMLQFVLRAAHVKESQVKLVTAASDVIPLLLSKKIDLATETTNYGGVEVLTTTHRRPTVLLAAKVGAPNVPIWVYATNTRWAQQHPVVVHKWLVATRRAILWSIAHPDQAVRIYEKAYPKTGATHAYNLAGWKATMVLLKGRHGFFRETDAQWRELTQALKSVHALTKVLPPSAYYTNSYQ
jgi:ABC-type nitrate/sulfonate/bicarbonate transport system substrate-binding protein